VRHRRLARRRLLLRLSLALAVMGALSHLSGPAATVYAGATRIIQVAAVDDDEASSGCTLREAIDLANAGAAGGTHANGCTVKETVVGPYIPILYALSLPAYRYTLTGAYGEDANASGDLDIAASVFLNGAGPDKTVISGGSIDRVFDIDPDGAGDFVVTFNRLTIAQGGVAGWGGGILSDDDTVSITRCSLSENRSGGLVGGGAVYNASGTLILNRTTVSDNSSDFGGGICNGGDLTLANSTVSGNEATFGGGGLHNAGGTASLSNVTITDNLADRYGDGSGDGGGIYRNGGTVTIKNTLVAGNSDGTPDPGTSHPDLSGEVDGNASNLVGNTAGCTGTAGTGSDVVDPDPGLGALADNGGDTWTHALSPHSAAYNAVTDCTDLGGSPVTSDQRGVVRPQGPACDIGAYELEPLVIYLPTLLKTG
jgi:CSLREA domain-containing protein